MTLRILSSLTFLAASSVASHGALVWQVGIDDNSWPAGDGGGPNASFIQEGNTNPLPGNPANPEVNTQSDDDYYFAGVYSTQVDGGSVYAPLGIVPANEEGAERAFAGIDDSLRYHFNLPASINASDLLSITFDANNLHGQPGGTEHYGVEVYFNNVLVGPEVDVNPGTLDFDFTTPAFTLAGVNAQNGYAGGNIGSGFDNYVELRGINYNATGGGNWMGVDFVQLDADPIPEPTAPMFLVIAATGLAILRRRR
ncbi:MAG: hypothetical protein ACI9UA_004715 [Pseudoalteromonas tetraodonis]|jgi:hypothetical protein